VWCGVVWGQGRSGWSLFGNGARRVLLVLPFYRRTEDI
jgi:hypothetical protein